MQIPCPHCGLRPVEEFSYLGDATLIRPDEDASEAEWCAYLYGRKNPAGRHVEYWQHVAGCRAVLKVVRNTLTHAIESAEIVGAHAASKMVEPAQ